VVETRADIRQELDDLGFTHLGTNRLNNFVDQAASRVVNEDLWGFRERTGAVTDTMTMEAPGSQVHFVVKTTDWQRILKPIDLETAYAKFGGSGLAGFPAGEPKHYYTRGDDTVGLVPTGTSFTVHYYTAGAWVTGITAADSESDVPIVPVQWRHTIVLAGQIECLRDDDRIEEVPSIQEQLDIELERMRARFLSLQVDEKRQVRPPQDGGY
jgi:hypothetical protein